MGKLTSPQTSLLNFGARLHICKMAETVDARNTSPSKDLLVYYCQTLQNKNKKQKRERVTQGLLRTKHKDQPCS